MPKKTKARREPDEVAKIKAQICQQLAEGMSLRAICRQEGMPAAATVCLWLSKDAAFAEQYTRAREQQADAIFEEMLDIADDGTNDWMERQIAEDVTVSVVNSEHIQRSRLRVDTRKWMLARMSPKKYGDKVDVEHKGEVGLTVQIVRFADLPVDAPSE